MDCNYVSLREVLENIAGANPAQIREKGPLIPGDEFSIAEAEFFEYWRPNMEWEMGISNAAYLINKAIHQSNTITISWWEFDTKKGFHVKNDEVCGQGIDLLTAIQKMSDTQRTMRFKYLYAWKDSGEPLSMNGLFRGLLFFGPWDEHRKIQTQFFTRDKRRVKVIRLYKQIKDIELLWKIAFNQAELSDFLNKHGVKHSLASQDNLIPADSQQKEKPAEMAKRLRTEGITDNIEIARRLLSSDPNICDFALGKAVNPAPSTLKDPEGATRKRGAKLKKDITAKGGLLD